MFYPRISRYSKANYFVSFCQNYKSDLETGYGNVSFKNYPSWFTFSIQRRIWSFHIAVSQRTAKKCTKNYNARTQTLLSDFLCHIWRVQRSSRENKTSVTDSGISSAQTLPRYKVLQIHTIQFRYLCLEKSIDQTLQFSLVFCRLFVNSHRLPFQ